LGSELADPADRAGVVHAEANENTEKLLKSPQSRVRLADISSSACINRF
jgi:hypothetical protein